MIYRKVGEYRNFKVVAIAQILQPLHSALSPNLFRGFKAKNTAKLDSNLENGCSLIFSIKFFLLFRDCSISKMRSGFSFSIL